MSIKLKVTDQQKKQMANVSIEARVLGALFNERKVLLDAIGREILESNGLSPDLYAMQFSPAEDKWDAILKPGVISLPGKVGVKPKNNGG